MLDGIADTTAHWVVSSSCTSLEDPNTFWAMLLQPLRTTTASTAASAKARIRFVLLMFFYPQKQQVKNAIFLHDTIVYRIFFLRASALPVHHWLTLSALAPPSPTPTR